MSVEREFFPSLDFDTRVATGAIFKSDVRDTNAVDYIMLNTANMITSSHRKRPVSNFRALK